MGYQRKEQGVHDGFDTLISKSKGCSIGCRCGSQHVDFQAWIRRLPSLCARKSV
jgi:hypothetical protein